MKSLVELRLTYELLHKEFPSLIFAHLSAFGTTGPEANRPGFDTTAFWVGTGLSASIHSEGLYTLYPPGFGDVATAGSMVAGIALALRERNESGIGLNVDTSLMQSGLLTQIVQLSAPKVPETD